MSRRTPFTLLHDERSHDTVEVLRELLHSAESGEVIGIAFAVMFKRRRFATDMAGECHRNPVFTRGMIAALDDCAGERMREASVPRP